MQFSAARRRIPLLITAVLALMLGGAVVSPVQAVPAAPTVSAATTTSLTATWVSTGAAGYTASAYTASSGGTPVQSCTTTTPTVSCAITALTAGTTYWIGVTGASTESARTSGTTVPEAPTGLAISSPTGSTLTATWSAATGATSYTASAYAASSGGSAIATCTDTAPPLTCTISGLSSITTYWIAVNATNTGGTSADSARVSGTTLASAPSVPLDVSVTGSDASLLVRWSAPASTGGGAITGYTANAWSAATGGSITESCTAAASATSCTLTPLTNGTTYYVSVLATNSVGDGTASERLARTPGSLPGAPRTVTTVRGDGTITVAWLAPTSEGSSPITSYTASVRTAQSSSAAVVGTCTTAGLTCAVSGVVNATVYYVSVAATSGVGQGGPSSFATSSALNAPGAPRNVVARAGNGYAAVSWSAPATLGGSAIAQYIVRAYHVAEGGDPIATCEPAPVTSLKCDLGPLVNGGNYFVDVTARNALLTGPASTPRVQVTTAALPLEPRNVTAVQEGGALRVRWQTPSADGGRPIIRYTASAHASPSSTQALGTCSTSGDTCLITGLEGYVYVDVTATTLAGTSPASQPRVRVFMTGAADAPRAVAVNQRGSILQVSWLRPLDDEGVPIAIYEVQARAQNAAEPRTCRLYAPQVPADTDPWSHRFTCTLAGLTMGTVYEITVSAANSVSTVAAAPISVRMKTGAPSAPRDVSFLPGDDVVGVGALLPASLGGSGSVALRFRAWTKESGGAVAAVCTSPLGKADSIGMCRLAGLDNYEPYWIDAAAKNSKGFSKVSARVRVEPSPQEPTAPRDFRVRSRGTDFIASWAPPIFDGGFEVRRYIVRATNRETGGDIVATCIAKAPDNSCELTGFEADQHLWFTVVAENTVGESDPSQTLDRTS